VREVSKSMSAATFPLGIPVTRRSLLEGKTIKRVELARVKDATRRHTSIEFIEFTDGSRLDLSVDELDHDYAITGRLFNER
jgi:hypothetical protein